MSNREPLLVGRIMRARGLRGEVLIKMLNPDSSLLAPGARVTLDRGAVEHRVLAARRVTKGWIVRFEGVDDRTAAEAIAGSGVLVAWDELPALQEGEFYYEELRGYRVVHRDGRDLGVVVGVFETIVDNLVVRAVAPEGKAREFVLPMVNDLVRNIDAVSRTVEVDPPEDLLHL